MTEEEIRKIAKDEAYKVCNSVFFAVLFGVLTVFVTHWLFM